MEGVDGHDMSGVFVCVCICAGEGATDERSCKIEEGNCCAVVHTKLKPPPHPIKCEKIKRYQIIINSFFRTLLSLLPIPPTPQAFFFFFSLCTNSTVTSFSSYTYNTWGKKKKEKKKHPPIYRVNLFYLDFFF